MPGCPPPGRRSGRLDRTDLRTHRCRRREGAGRPPRRPRQAGGEANIDGNRDAPREIGAGPNIRVVAVRNAVTAMLTAGASSSSPQRR